MPKTIAVLQARLGSSRLPGKAVLSVGGYPIAALAALRAANCGLPVVVATSTEPEDDVVAAVASRAGILVVRGSLDDPLERFNQVVNELGLVDEDVVVRLTGDNTVPDGSFISALVASRERLGVGYIRVDPATIYGLGGEAFSAGDLRRAHRDATSPYDREHVTPWIRRELGDATFREELWAGFPHLRITVDTLDDYVVAVRVFAQVDDPVGISWQELLGRWSELAPKRAILAPSRPNPIGQGPWLLGTAQLGSDDGITNETRQPPRETARRILQQAASLGVTHVDNARA